MTLKKVGTYGQIVGGMPLGLGEENWWTKIGQDYMQDVPDAVAVSPGNVGDVVGGMPLGYGSPTFQQDMGKAIDPLTGLATVPPAETPPVIPPAATPPVDPLATPPELPTTPPVIPPLAPATPGADVAYTMTPFGGRTAYQSSYDPTLEAQQNALALKNAQAAALPGLNEALAGAREDAARAGGGEATGMFSEFSRKPLEKFSQEMAQTSGQLEINSLQAQKEDKKAKAVWDMEQDVKEHDWLRGETAKLFGANYAQDLNDKEWERNNAADVAKSNIEIAFKNGEISRDEAWKRWSATNDERLRKLSEQRADLEWQRTVAQQEKMFDKQAILSKEIAALDRESAKQIASNQEDASMWGAIGSAAVTIGAAALFSDRRLKENIKRIGTNLLGIGIYEFNYLWDKVKHIGVMADEVKQIMPKAVIRHSSGYDMVNYSMLGGDINGS